MEKKLEDMNVVELKALVYDLLSERERLQQSLNLVQQILESKTVPKQKESEDEETIEDLERTTKKK